MFPFGFPGAAGYTGVYGSLGLYGGIDLYGSWQLTALSPPQSFTEPLALIEVKAFLNIEQSNPPDDVDDVLLESLIPAARSEAERFQTKTLVIKQIDRTYDYWPSNRIQIGTPLISVDLIQYRDSNGAYHLLTENVDYVVAKDKSPAVVAPAYMKSWPSFTAWPLSAVLIRCTAGYAPDDAFWSDAGARLKLGMKYLISDWYEERLPFTPGIPLDEYPFKIRGLLGAGAAVSVR